MCLLASFPGLPRFFCSSVCVQCNIPRFLPGNKAMFAIYLYFTCNPGTKPTLPELLRFTCADQRVTNIPVEIATKYVRFGIFLLNDRTGSRVKIMAHKHLNDAERINTEILQEWVTGRGRQPVTWATLVKVLHYIELSTLAGEIEAVKCPAGPVSN